ncbi:hypothetical protein CVM52_05700 [Pseudooceanicola lipolyticus]|uniref:VCBS repeat-containing protein n=1 Tax=Pseudooceanicola lipolyticus TaxID=2029104 RepID=A0A2M8J4N7_9RHOB|nr:hypothetical protein [Pseudooceanicola lipolyticus]PJE37733.1 hypothetical protein CVM52_05700 [Pseudooceanicola lipolyticus]
MRRAAHVAALLLSLVACSAAAQTRGPDAAEYGDPTGRYDHGVLGDALEWGSLTLRTGAQRSRITLPPSRVFEDTAPRIVQIAPDRRAALVVESDVEQGARLALYDRDGLIAATPFIGQRHRWLSPLGAADLDGDGFVEIAYIDRPHLARVLRIWRFRDGALHPVANRAGLTNHRIGQEFISGGIRACGARPEIVSVNADWSRVMLSRLVDGRIETRGAGRFAGPESLAKALRCGG